MKVNKVGIRKLQGKRGAVAVCIVTPFGVPLARDPKKSPPFWKAPGGKCWPGEEPKEGAIREVEHETGLILSEEELILLHPPRDFGSHLVSLFVAKHENLLGLKSQGDEREEIKVFSVAEILSMTDFFGNHRVFKDFLGRL